MREIRQPVDLRFQVSGGPAGALEWDPGFAQRWSGRYALAQTFLDSEVLRLNERYIPLRDGGLKRSGILGTRTGSGEVRYIAPYARYQYYGKLMVGPAPKTLTNTDLVYHAGDPNRGAFWFEMMKARHLGELTRGVQALMRGD